MRKIALLLFLSVSSVISLAQSDTLYTAKKKIVCKIHEINEYEVKYRLADLQDGPIYVIDKSTVLKYTLSNGFTEIIVRDELSLEHEHGEILHCRQVVKIHPFSVPLNHLSFSYEQVIKVGMNLDVEAGYINSSFNTTISNRVMGSPFHVGAYFKPGVKFFLGQDFSVRGLKYAHPLKGRYVKLDLATSYVNYQGLIAYDYNYGYSSPTRTVTSNLNTFSYGAFVNYGRQFILGNVLTLDYYVGVGFTGVSYNYTNPEFLKLSYYDYQVMNGTYNYYGFLRTPQLGLSFTAGFRIGYIIPEKKKDKKPVTASAK
ncbi:MAG: hypothetical protein K0S12_487 [Bacteroidetes bacterium]|jgi:hypothetical protein|nr:hypothetical protein [Bacteroidota bacterium]